MLHQINFESGEFSLLGEKAQLTTCGGAVVTPVLLPLFGAGLGLYAGICSVAYYAGYAAHAVYDQVSKK